MKKSKTNHVYFCNTKKKWFGYITVKGRSIFTSYRENPDGLVEEVQELIDMFKSSSNVDQLIIEYKRNKREVYLETLRQKRIENKSDKKVYEKKTPVISVNSIYRLRQLNYTYSHTGAENQKVYMTVRCLRSSNFYIELIEYPDKGWAYHVDKGKNFICDSRIVNKYYSTKEECIDGMISSLVRLGYK